MEDSPFDTAVTSLPVHTAELCVWPDKGQIEPLRAGVLDRDDSRDGDVCLSWLAGQRRRRTPPADDGRVGAVRRRPARNRRGNGVCYAFGQRSSGPEDWQQ